MTSPSPDESSQNLNISVPKDELGKDSSVLFKIQPKKPKEEKVQKFRSFSFSGSVQGHFIMICGKQIAVAQLYRLLVENGLSSTVPAIVSLNSVEFLNFDWNPIAYNGPTTWEFRWNGILCSIAGVNSSYASSITIRVHDMTAGVGEQILNEITAELLKRYKDPTPEKSLTIFTAQKNGHGGFAWATHSTRLHRSLATIYMDDAIKKKLVTQLTKFLASSKFYDEYGITWKRVHMFDGLPGAGKTSTVLALASWFGQNIAKLTITDDLDSRACENLFATLPPNTFLLLEDVDALFTERKAVGSIDFSTLLQCMDGLTTRRGLVLFMTTNHIGKLDAAFLRPGRVDCRVEFTPPGREQFRLALQALAPQYAHEHDEFLEKNTATTIAALQKHLFDCIMEEKKSIL